MRITCTLFRSLCIAILSVLLSGCGKTKEGPPYGPEEALKTFRVAPGYRIELVASEPLITDPVEIAFDANGLLYVAEMEDYPAESAPGGKIMVLEDTDGDGFYETGKAFADNLPYVNGVMPWRNGVLVTSAPDILYLEDTTGDRRADIRRVVLTGFALTNPQLRMSSLRYGLDNWIYGAYSWAGGQRGYPQFSDHGHPLTFPGDPEKDSADIYPTTDFRFRPDEFKVEPSGGTSQFGLSFDAKGNRYAVWNNVHIRHVVIDARYLRRNPYLRVSSLMAHISDHGDAATVFSRAENRLDLHESEIGHFTSACGNTIYTGGLFQGDYNGAAFICEPVSNIVHADLLAEAGATFSAHRAVDGDEFLTSTDSWFRPVNTTVGPDGGLYVVDFYRKLVEHPAWIARADDKGIYTHAGVLQESDFLEGHDRGRVYRIVPDDFGSRSVQRPALATADNETLVKTLAHPNMWWRTQAQRLLVGKGDVSAVPSIIKFLNSNPSPEGKIHALWTLEGLRQLTDDIVLEALTDKSAIVRKHAIRLAETRLPDAKILDRVMAMAENAAEDAGVQFQLALTLTGVSHTRTFQPLTGIALQHIDDPWFRTAVLLNAGENALQWYEAARTFEVSGDAEEGKMDMLKRIASIAAARRDGNEISRLLALVQKDPDPAFQKTGLQGVSEGLRPGTKRLALPADGERLLLQFIVSTALDVQDAALELAEKLHHADSPALRAAVAESMRKLSDENVPIAARANAVRVVGLSPGKLNPSIFESLLTPRQPERIQAAAARVLVRSDDTVAMNLLLKHWPTYTAEVRTVVENGITGTSEKVSFLMKALERGSVQPQWLSRTTRSRLAAHPDQDIQQRAEKVFGDPGEDDRDEVVTAFYEATTLRGDPSKGRDIFRKACSACHRMENVGTSFGPDLLGVSNQTRINLLTMILHPNNNIAQGYDGYEVETSGGQMFIGILANENSSAVTLHTADGGEHVIARENIKRILPLTESLMPEGLEGTLDKQDLADLLEYLKNGNSAVSANTTTSD